MLVKMKETMPGSLNGGRTAQDFEGGKIYDVPASLGADWIKDDKAMAIGQAGKAQAGADKAAAGPKANK